MLHLPCTRAVLTQLTSSVVVNMCHSYKWVFSLYEFSSLNTHIRHISSGDPLVYSRCHSEGWEVVVHDTAPFTCIFIGQTPIRCHASHVRTPYTNIFLSTRCRIRYCLVFVAVFPSVSKAVPHKTLSIWPSFKHATEAYLDL